MNEWNNQEKYFVIKILQLLNIISLPSWYNIDKKTNLLEHI